MVRDDDEDELEFDDDVELYGDDDSEDLEDNQLATKPNSGGWPLQENG